MNHQLYQKYLHDYLQEALGRVSHNTPAVMVYLSEMEMPGRFARHREERLKAITTLRQAFEEHRHWPLEIVISHLGLDAKQLLG